MLEVETERGRKEGNQEKPRRRGKKKKRREEEQISLAHLSPLIVERERRGTSRESSCKFEQRTRSEKSKRERELIVVVDGSFSFAQGYTNTTHTHTHIITLQGKLAKRCDS